MFLLNIKTLGTVLLLAGSVGIAFASEPEEDGEGDKLLSLGPCPAEFMSMPLYPMARFCQVFADTPPASLSYHADTDIDHARAFYLELLGEAESEDMLAGRVLLQYQNGNKIIVISRDGQGAQVDILIK
jgi:hypothetical protein